MKIKKCKCGSTDFADINLVVKEITKLFLPEISEGSWNFTHRNDKIKEYISLYIEIIKNRSI
jgi:hypothetical protein